MARTALPKLELDDPLRARAQAVTPDRAGDAPGTQEASEAERPKRTRARRSSATAPPAPTEPDTDADGPWRRWGTGSRTATYRLPEALLEELDERARRLNLPLGLTVAAGVLLLLDQDDRALIEHVDRVEDARRAAQRAARPAPS